VGEEVVIATATGVRREGRRAVGKTGRGRHIGVAALLAVLPACVRPTAGSGSRSSVALGGLDVEPALDHRAVAPGLAHLGGR
jgi:hypothetical protein